MIVPGIPLERGYGAFELMESKLTPPARRPGTIHRSALVNRMRVARRGGVTLLTAPAGYGKTTLLADWAEADRRPFAWVSLDESDNDPVVFLTYVATALDRIEPIDSEVFDALGTPGSLARRGLARLGRSVLSFEVPSVLVLDDVHLLDQPTAREALRTLIEHLPEPLQLVLSTRSSSVLPLGRLRAEGRIVELGVDELRLREREAAALLKATGVSLSTGDVVELTRGTEGGRPACISRRSGSARRRRPRMPSTAATASSATTSATSCSAGSNRASCGS